MTDETSPEEWFTWKVRGNILREMEEADPARAFALSSALATLEALYPRR